jgi:hypothetical protein
MNLPLPALSRSSTSLVGNRLLAALTLGIAAAAVVPSVEAGVVTINLTDTRNNGTTTTDDTIAGVNAGVTAGNFLSLANWLGANTGTLNLINAVANTYLVVWGPLGDSADLEFAYASGTIGPARFSGGALIDSSDFSDSPSSPSDAFLRIDVGLTTFSLAPAFGAGNYLGFRFGSGGTYNYGYLGATWDGSSNFHITSGAYESTAGQSITIPGGGGSSVPDSSSTGLMGLLFAGAAVRQWRKSRR